MKKRIGIAALILGVAFLPALWGEALAKSNYLAPFNAKYGTSGSVLDTCSLCHPGGNTKQKNAFAQDFASGSIGNHTYNAALEARDSDGDGFSNLVEINARTFPGDAASKPADTTPPQVTAFAIPGTAASLTVPISTFTATDNVGVTGYALSESNSAPGSGWAGSAPTSYTFATAGSKTLYAWAKDVVGNVSPSRNASVTITLPPDPPPPPGPPPGPDMTTWVDKWFRMNITIDETRELAGLGLVGDGRKAKAYLHIQNWDPATGVFDATLYQYDRAGDAAVAWVWMPLSVISGDCPEFESWCQFLDDPTTAFTSQIKGKWAKGSLVKGSFRSLGDYQVSGEESGRALSKAGSFPSGWLKMRGKMVSVARVPETIMALLGEP